MRILFTLALSCVLPSGLAAAAPPRDGPAAGAALADVANGTRSCRDLRVEYRDGTVEDGWTRVVVAGGWVTVAHGPTEGPPAVFRGPLEAEMCRRLAGNAASGELWRLRARERAGLPGESRPEIRMGVKGAGGFTARSWCFDVQDQRAFAVARGQLVVLAIRVSGGLVTW